MNIKTEYMLGVLFAVIGYLIFGYLFDDYALGIVFGISMSIIIMTGFSGGKKKAPPSNGEPHSTTEKQKDD